MNFSTRRTVTVTTYTNSHQFQFEECIDETLDQRQEL
jgi:hypothetical protein